MVRVGFLLIFFIQVIFYSSCTDKEDKKITINFMEKDDTVFQRISDTTNTLKVAISAMISPKSTFVYYQELLDYLAKKTNCKIILIQRKTYQEINTLLESGELDFAFICSGAYVELASKCKTNILAVPQSNGKLTYQAYIITHSKSGVNKFEDFKGKSFAFTDMLSNSGRLYALKRLKEIGETDKSFFSSIVFTYGHDNSIKLVNNGLVDGATIDGLIFNFISINNPEQVSNIKIIEKSENYGIPPIVSRLDKTPKLESIRNTLLNMADDSVGSLILSKLQIDKFVAGKDSSYNSIRKILSLLKK